MITAAIIVYPALLGIPRRGGPERTAHNDDILSI
jgi:hypothetical protein